MSYMTLEILSPFKPPRRVLNFGKYKGWTIWEVHDRKPGYLAWCRNTLGKAFTDELNAKEHGIVLSDYTPIYFKDPSEERDRQKYTGTWGDPALWCGCWCEADTF